MYIVEYGAERLHDPRAEAVLASAELKMELNASGTFTFSLYPNHPLYDSLVERDTENPIRIWQDGELLFYGDILNIETDFQLAKIVTCRSDLGWLNDSIVRPYSTLPAECDNQAPPSVNGYFEWLIEGHNSQVEQSKTFVVGKNEGALLDDNNYIHRSDSTYPTTGSVIKEKVIESLGGYVVTRGDFNTRYIDLVTDFDKVNAQIIDFGVNLLDYMKTMETENMATFVVPVGQTIEIEGDSDVEKVPLRVNLSELGDGYISGDFFKSGDIIYSESAVKKYGWIGAMVEFDDVTEATNLKTKGLAALKGMMEPACTMEMSAVDLAMIDPNYKPIYIGQYVRVRSAPHDFDSYLLCSRVELNLLDPQRNKYTLGHTLDVLTGTQNKTIRALNATVNHVYEQTSSISDTAKQAAMLATEANERAQSLKTTTTLSIESSNGSSFDSGVEQTILTARVFEGDTELTEEQVIEKGAAVTWYADGVQHATGMSVTVSKDEFDTKTTLVAQLEVQE